MRKKTFACIILISVFSIIGINCSYFKSKVIENIKVKEIKSVRITKIPVPFINNKTEFTFLLGVMNDNPFDVVLKKTEFEVYIESTKIGDGTGKTEQTLAKNSMNDLSIKFSCDAREILINGVSLIQILTSDKQLEFKLVGDLTTLSDDKEYIVPFTIADMRKIIQ